MVLPTHSYLDQLARTKVDLPLVLLSLLHVLSCVELWLEEVVADVRPFETLSTCVRGHIHQLECFLHEGSLERCYFYYYPRTRSSSKSLGSCASSRHEPSGDYYLAELRLDLSRNGGPSFD